MKRRTEIVTIPVWGEPDGGEPVKVTYVECPACGEVEYDEEERTCDACHWPDREEDQP